MFLSLLFGLAFSCFSAAGPAEQKETWGYVTVRQDAYLFWWLYYTDQTEDYSSYPLVMWLQGGPSVSSTGVGNFKEIGPLDIQLNPRDSTWLKKASLLFLDSPVGTGFSYVTNKSALTRNNAQIATDLMTTLSSILQTVPEFQKSPLYIFGESYGGKMVIDFAAVLTKAIRSNSITCNFKGIALGDSWISPLDSVYTWGTFLYTMSFLDKSNLQDVKGKAYQIKKSLMNQKFAQATEQFGDLQDVIDNYTNSVDWYNILKEVGPAEDQNNNKLPNGHKLCKMYSRMVGSVQEDTLHDLMNGPIRRKLGIIPKNVTWSEKSFDVFEALSEDFMKNVIASVDSFLSNETHIDVNIYTGQLDLIVDTLGTLAWVERLKWDGLKDFQASPKKVMTFPGNRTAGFVKSFKQLSFFWILKSGHMVPLDAPETALMMLDMILSKKQ